MAKGRPQSILVDRKMRIIKASEVTESDFDSLAFPSPEDKKLWDSLNPEQQRALIARSLDDAEKSGPAEAGSMDDLIARVRAKEPCKCNELRRVRNVY